MKKKKLLALILMLFIAINSGNACLNEYRALLNGSTAFKEQRNARPREKFNTENKALLLKKLHEADSIYKRNGSLEDYSDWATMLVYNGNYAKAKEIFLEIERKIPGRYQSASNLGTVYELLGNNDSAHFWIKKALQINPASHQGSEWIHLKILDAKKSKKNLQETNVLGLDFGSELNPENKLNYDLPLLKEHLYYQLKERMFFIKPKDEILAQLLFDLGNVCAIDEDVKSALQVYEVAEEYGCSSDLFKRRKTHFERLQSPADLRTVTENWIRKHTLAAALIALAGLIAFLSIVIHFVRKKFRKGYTKNSHAS